MTNDEKFEIERKIALDFWDGVITKEEYFAKMDEFEKQYEDIDYLKWYLANKVSPDDKRVIYSINQKIARLQNNI